MVVYLKWKKIPPFTSFPIASTLGWMTESLLATTFSKDREGADTLVMSNS